MHFSRDVKIRQGRRQRELTKRNSFNKQNDSSASAAFPSRQDVKIPKLRVNKRPRNRLFHSEFGYGSEEFNFRRVRLDLAKPVRSSKSTFPCTALNSNFCRPK